MGSFIIDDIVYANGKRVTNILGGAGIFAIYGKLPPSRHFDKNDNHHHHPY